MSGAASAATADHERLLDLALEPARAAGATAIATVSRTEHWSAVVADSAVESLSDSTGQGLGLAVVFADGRKAGVSTTDLGEATVRRLAEEAVALARCAEPDQWAALAPLEQCGQEEVAGLDDGGAGFDRERALALVLEAERLARAADRRIVHSHRCGASMARSVSRTRSSHGLDFARRGSRYGYHLSLVAEDGGDKQTGWASTSNRRRADLRRPAAVAAEAVERVLRGFGWSKPPSGPVRVLFDNDTASELLGLVASLASGGNVYRGSTCWADQLGKAVGSPLLTVDDLPLLPGGPGSRGCDSEGVRARPLALVEGGVLRYYLTDSYAARRLSQPFTGHADGCSNLRLRPGAESRAALLARLGRGLLVTDLEGHGVDLSSGQWSKGASGLWVEGGAIRHPVQGITLAGRLPEMFRALEAVGDDPLPEHAISSPSLLIGGLMLGGG